MSVSKSAPQAHPFLARLDQGVMVADGAMGTLLYARGVPFDQCFDELNLSRPELIRQIHLDYIASGAELIETNTFGANRFKLASHNLEHRLAEINRAGAAVAREAAEASGRSVFVAGSMGPIGRPIAPLGSVAPEEGRESFAEQAAALVEGGADVLILETFSDLGELLEVISGVRSAVTVPIIAQMTFTQEGKTLLGHTPQEIARTLVQLGVEVVGANCSVGPQGILEVMQQMAAEVPDARLSAMPNAGFPAYVGGRYIYFSTPAHIAAIRAALAQPVPSERVVIESASTPAPRPSSEPAVTTTAPEAGTLAHKLGRHFVITVEIDPPRGVTDRRELDGCRRLKESGVDTIDVADNPMARLRMSPWAMCARIQSEVGMETILHFTTRDRNLMRLQSDLLAVD